MKPFKFLRKPKHYINEQLEFIGYTPILYEPNTFQPIRGLLYRDLINGSILKIGSVNLDDVDERV